MGRFTDDLNDMQAPEKAAPVPWQPEVAPQVRAALEVAETSGLDWDRANRAVMLGRKLGLPPRVVSENMQMARNEEIARKIDGNELFASWVGRDELKAAVAAGNVDKMADLCAGLQKEYQHRQAQRNDLNAAQKFGLLLQEGGRDVLDSLEAFASGFARHASRTDYVNRAGELREVDMPSLRDWADEKDKARDEAFRARPPRLEAASTLGGYFQDIARMIPQYGSQVVASMVGGPVGGMAMIGAQIAGGQYDRLRREGVDPDRAFIAGLVNAALQAPLEQIGLGKFFGIFKTSGLRNIAKRTVEASGKEFLTEWAQAYPESATDIWAKLQGNEGARLWFERFMQDFGETTKQGIYEGLVAAPFGVFGGIGRAVQENARNAYVNNFRERQVDLHARIEALRQNGMAEELLQSALEHGGLNFEVGIDAKGIVELEQAGHNVIAALGLDAQAVETAFQAGQDIYLPLAKLHASLDKAAFDGLAPHIRPAENGPTANEAAENPAISLDALEVAQLYQDNVQIFNEMDAEIRRLENEVTAAISRNPAFVEKQLKPLNLTPEKYIKQVVGLHEKHALARARHGLDPVAYLRKVTFDEGYARRRENELAARANQGQTSESQTGENAAAPQETVPPQETAAPEEAALAGEEAAAENAAPATENAAQTEETAETEEEAALKEKWLKEIAEEEAAKRAAEEAARQQGQTPPETAASPETEAEAAAPQASLQETDAASMEYRSLEDELDQMLRAVLENPDANLDETITTASDIERMATRHARDLGWSEEAIASDMAEFAADENATETPAVENGHVIGMQTQILGKNVADAARYEVWEMDDIIPSHDPENQFAKREDYPAEAQERPYHSDPGEQQKVTGNAVNYNPSFTITDDPTAGNGPPIITKSGIVLGGNSRTMTLQLVYAQHDKAAQAYRERLGQRANAFGIDPQAVAGMRKPVLVRVVEDMPLKEMAIKSRQYNQTTTQKLQAEAEGVSRARMISPDTLALLANALEADPEMTLRKYLDSPASRKLIMALQNDGVIQETEISSLTDESGLLNGAGKDLAENAFRGLVVPQYDVLKATPKSVLNKLDRLIPTLARLKNRGEGWDLTPVITAALRLVGKADKENRHLEDWLGQADLLESDPDKKRPAVQALALMFAKAKQGEILARLNLFADEAGKTQKGVGALMAAHAEKANPAPAFVRAFLKPVVVAGGKPVANFSPETNEEHAAIEWASKNGKTLAEAMRTLEKKMRDKKTSPEMKAQLRSYMGVLASLDGKVERFDPNLGSFFRYKEGEELFQDKDREYIREDLERKPDDATAKVIELQENEIPALRVNELGTWVLNLLAEQGRNVVIKSTGQEVEFTQKNVRASLKRSSRKRKGSKEHDKAYHALREMIANAEYWKSRSEDSRHEKQGDQDVYTSALKMDGKLYSVIIKVTVIPEFVRDRTIGMGLDIGDVRYKDHTVAEIEIAPALSQTLPKLGDHLQGTTDAINDVSLGILRGAVKPSRIENNTLYQNKRGSVRILSDTYLVSLFEDADLSTLLHETGHIFFEEMKKLVESGHADEAMLKDYNTMRSWLGAKEGEELTVEQREQAARGFEAWLMEGKAPSRELKSAFGRFKKWLLAIYRQIANLNVELTDDLNSLTI